MIQEVESCFRLLTHEICCALHFALESAGNSIAARMAMMAMTTSNSINVKPWRAAVFLDGKNLEKVRGLFIRSALIGNRFSRNPAPSQSGYLVKSLTYSCRWSRLKIAAVQNMCAVNAMTLRTRPGRARHSVRAVGTEREAPKTART